MFDGVKVFSATLARDRIVLGEKVTEWLEHNPDVEIIDIVATQSSDAEFHCTVITIFYKGKVANANAQRNREEAQRAGGESYQARKRAG